MQINDWQKTKQTRRKYDATFKEEVLKMVASGRPISEIAQALGVGENLIYRWKSGTQNANKGNAGTNASNNLPDATAEIERLKAELRRTEQERDILKKPWES
ncbi:transposase [Paraflavitalea speifideaquila]|uniref:transposase n=1 Tax=Paraflavitalea speifideaquila TaxID=3076558 RepID=UPI0028F13403|nr:transposase [Paraflavitalea speifideiaquila]